MRPGLSVSRLVRLPRTHSRSQRVRVAQSGRHWISLRRVLTAALPGAAGSASGAHGWLLHRFPTHVLIQEESCHLTPTSCCCLPGNARCCARWPQRAAARLLFLPAPGPGPGLPCPGLGTSPAGTAPGAKGALNGGQLGAQHRPCQTQRVPVPAAPRCHGLPTLTPASACPQTPPLPATPRGGTTSRPWASLLPV